MVKKRVKIKIGDLKGDVLPEVSKMLHEEMKRQVKYFGKEWMQKIVKPQTLEDLLFGALVDLRETVLRMQAIIIKPNSIAFSIDKKELFEVYVENLKRHIGRIINLLEELGHGMETPPE